MSTQPAATHRAYPRNFHWGVTRDAVWTATERPIAAIDPLRIVAFGSRARGTQRPDSDLDIAVILDPNSPLRPTTKLWTLFDDLNMSVDMLVADEPRHLELSHSINSVHHAIANEGVVLYRKGGNGIPDADAVEKVSRGWANCARTAGLSLSSRITAQLPFGSTITE